MSFKNLIKGEVPRRFRGVIAYDGTDLQGFQSQPHGNTVQDVLQKRLSRLFQKKIVIQGASRTDAGVHARGALIAFAVPWTGSTEQLFKVLSTLPPHIQIKNLLEVNNNFHIFNSIKEKEYVYSIFEGVADPFATRYCYSVKSTLDIDLMNEASAHMIGRHDFTSFSTPSSDHQDPIKTISKIEVERESDRVRIRVVANSFLYHMVRKISGFLIEVGTGKYSPKDCIDILEGKKKYMWMAPPNGLFLHRVYLKQSDEMYMVEN